MIAEISLSVALFYVLIGWTFTSLTMFQILPKSKIEALACIMLGVIWPIILVLELNYAIRGEKPSVTSYCSSPELDGDDAEE